MDGVPSVEENSSDGLFPAPTSGFYDESTNLFPSLNELSQSFVLDSSLTTDTRSTPSKVLSETTKRKKTAMGLKTDSVKAKSSSYERKIKHLKRMAKELVYTNAALLDELSACELDISKAKQERKALLKRLFQFLPMTEAQALQSSQALKSLAPTFQGNIPPSILGPLPPQPVVPLPSQSKRKKKPIKGVPSKKCKTTTLKEKT